MFHMLIYANIYVCVTELLKPLPCIHTTLYVIYISSHHHRIYSRALMTLAILIFIIIPD